MFTGFSYVKQFTSVLVKKKKQLEQFNKGI